MSTHNGRFASSLGVVLVGLAIILVLPVPASAQESGPIYVDSISELLAVFPLIKGEGTADSPFILSGVVVDANNADYALHLENVHIPVVLRGLRLHSARGPESMGAISLVNCSNIRIESCKVSMSDIGIRLFNCRDCVITGNDIGSNVVGISIDILSKGNQVTGNCLDNEINAIDAGQTTWTSQQGIGNQWSDLDIRLRAVGYPIPPNGLDVAPMPLGAACSLADTLAPSIHILGRAYETIECCSSYTDPGFSAYDDVDGEVEVIVSGSINPEEVGVYTLTYTTCDSSGNCESANRIVTVKDTQAPVFLDSCPSDLEIQVGEEMDSLELEAMDNCDGALKAALDLSEIDTSRVGEHQVTARLCDQNGNCSDYAFMVRVVDHLSPVIELIGSSPLALSPEEVTQIQEHDPGALAHDNYDGDISDRIVTAYPDLLHAEEGVIIYTVTDSSGNSASLERPVVIRRNWEVPNPPEGLPLEDAGLYVAEEDGYGVTIKSTGSAREWLSSTSAWLKLGKYLMKLAESAPEDARHLSIRLVEASEMLAQFAITLTGENIPWAEDTLGVIQFWRSVADQDMSEDLSNPFRYGAEDSQVEAARGLGEAILPILLGQCPYSLEITPRLKDGKTEVASTSVAFNLSTCSMATEDIPALTERVGRYFCELIPRVPVVSAAVYADLYGLVYRVEFTQSESGIQSSVVYRHPGLFP